ncbi:NUDIX hydrolase [Thermoactinospora rubra]|uniref:NUDIX hydrolase n=1 Tax=Thermoactinospora rubra TaxID=1088767 RepID=UPI0023E3F75A|nr:NUDIX domain-containing protein [Thermoactinospora rubra]
MIPLRRFTARAMPVNHEGKVLLLQGFEPNTPHITRWFTIGGAMEDGETLQEAAARELHEEAGILVEPAAFAPPYGTSTIRFTFGEWDITQDQTFLAVYVGDAPVSLDRMEEIEKATTIGWRWWSAEELEDSDVLYHPEDLPTLIKQAVSLVG